MIVRNDYTLINRLEKVYNKYILLNHETVSDVKSARYFRLAMSIRRVIDETKEDLKLKAQQSIVNCYGNENINCHYNSIYKLYKDTGLNITDLTD